MPELHALNPLTLPLTGRQLIEASAGTGKTWTLAALYVRLVLGHVDGQTALGVGRYPPQILVMTFTEAATAELRGRIRERLAQAAAYFRQDPDAEADVFLNDLGKEIDAGVWAECAYRLEMAAQWMDDAAIFTIHGWSHRMLQQHAFDSASLFQQDKVDNAERLQLMATQDYWRTWFYPLDAADLKALEGLGEAAKSPGKLLKALKDLWKTLERGPDAALSLGDDPHALIRRWRDWAARVEALQDVARAAWTTHAAQLKPVLLQAMQEDLSGVVYKKDQHQAYLDHLDAWSQGGEGVLKILERFGRTKLHDAKSRKKDRNPPDDSFGVFAAIQHFVDELGARPAIEEALLAHAADAVARAYAARKRELAQFDFSDLLQRLYYALQASDGRLAEAIRQQYPVALVDEFQDTDPWQYGALTRIYGVGGELAASDVNTGLILIGDPKQAIYGFRGADLNTYLAARQEVDGIYTLTGNYRSTEALVNAVNHVFRQAHAPFGEVPYAEVQACNAKVKPLQIDGQPHPAMTVWHVDRLDAGRKGLFQRDSAEVFASQMVHLLNQGAARPGEMAVLVRDRNEARAIRNALSARGVRSVYLSERDSVFASDEAEDLWRLLRAIAQPRHSGRLKAALATRLWGLGWPELERILHDEAAWENAVDQTLALHLTWQRQGFLPMLYQWLHEQAIPERLLGAGAERHDGERRLTNLLHLGDLLQTASLNLHGDVMPMRGLIRHLEARMQDPALAGDAAQLRLESDADLVQVITLHKSKGLQYPLVFLPFVTGYRGKGKVEAAQLAEDVRLLYVALTRAERALWLGVTQLRGDFDGKTPDIRTAFSRLLGRETPGDLPIRLQAWAACTDIRVDAAPEPNRTRFVPHTARPQFKPALTPPRRVFSPWWTASFSALTRTLETHLPAMPLPPDSERDAQLGDAQLDSTETEGLQGAAPEIGLGAGEPLFNAFKAGSEYGTLLHALLEWQTERGWPAHTPHASTMAAEWARLVERKAHALELDDAQQRLLLDWIPKIVSTPLPLAAASPLILGELSRPVAWAEMNFNLPVRALSSTDIDALIQRALHPGIARPALQAVQLEGMLTGFIDLVVEHEGRYFVLDYKSNRLPHYDPEQLTASILSHRYDVQYTFYVLALHRLLKHRLPDYDYDLHIGGAIYLFLRGIDQPGAGVYQQRPDRMLIEALDQAFAGIRAGLVT